MAAQSAAEDQDQSMEEILQSIKRIIADEDSDDDLVEAAPIKRGAGSDVLELTDIVQDDGTVVNAAKLAEIPQKAAFEEAPIPPVAKKPEPSKAEAKPVAAPAPKPAPKPEPFLLEDEEDGTLISMEAVSASAESLRALANRNKPASKPRPESDGLAFRSGETVEDLVMELMRPMLKQWLDNNLPVIVERLVEREVKRISGQ